MLSFLYNLQLSQAERLICAVLWVTVIELYLLSYLIFEYMKEAIWYINFKPN